VKSKLKTDSSNLLDELAQAKLRNYMHLFLVVLTMWAYHVGDNIVLYEVVLVSLASVFSAAILYFWAFELSRQNLDPKHRVWQRACSILSDNTFISLVLFIGGESTAGVWAIYIWISIGYGVRYSVEYLRVNVAVSLVAFSIVCLTVPFWKERTAFTVGMVVAMTIVPLYVGWLIQQLHTAVKERELAYAAKSEFTARMSHELRTPLHAIISTVDILKSRDLDHQATDLLHLISVSSTTLLDLINKVLDLSKFESGSYRLADVKLNLQEVISECIQIVFSEANSKGIDLKFYFDSAIEPQVHGPPSEIKEIFINLLGNAVKFTEHGSVAVRAELSKESPTHVGVSFTISDTGQGIPETILPTILEPFVQADSSPTRKHGGTGLGTAFASEIVRSLGGTLDVESTVSEGTVFTVYLSFRRQEDPIRKDIPNSLTIVLISPEPEDRVLAESLETFGINVLVAGSIDEAAEIVSEYDLSSRIHGALLNLDPYGANIPGAIADLRKSCNSRIFPISGIGDEEYRTVAAVSGCISFAPRPLNTETQRRILDEIAAMTVASSPRDLAYRADPNESDTLEILVADDDPTNRQIFRMVLEGAGHKATVVTNGEDALFEMNDKRFDAAVLDMHMPGRDGIEVAKIYRFANFEEDRRVPIILFTADTTQSTREHARNAGVDLFVTKPIRPRNLLDAIYEVISRVASDERPTYSIPSGDTRVTPIVRVVNVQSTKATNYFDEQAVSDLLSFMTKAEQIEFFRDFAEDAKAYVGTFESAVTEDDMNSAKNNMHALAGAAMTVGALQLGELAKELELLSSAEALARREDLTHQLNAVCQSTLEEIDEQFRV